MVARWFFDSRPSEAVVQLHLYWDEQMAPAATIASPPEVAELLNSIDSNGMEVPSALAAAVLVSAKSKTQLRITGDRTAWRPEWGVLDDVAPPLN